MAAYKLTMLFNLTTGISTPNLPIHRGAGWSESVYGNFASVQALLTEANRGSGAGGGVGGFFAGPGNAAGLFQARAALLPLGAALTGYRVQQVDVPGPTQTGFLSFPGASPLKTDIPQQALLVRSPGVGVNNIRRFTIRCIPDDVVLEGEYQPTAAFNTAANQYLASLGSWAFRAKQAAGTPFKVISISAAGVVQFESPPGFALNQMVRVTRSRDSGGNLRSGRYQVSVVGPGTVTFTLLGWQWGATTGGTVRIDATTIYPAIDWANTTISRVVTRKVGRPFVGYRGRRSKRR